MRGQRHEWKALFESASQKESSSVLDAPIHKALPRRLAGVQIVTDLKVGMAVALQAELREFTPPFER